MIEMVTLVSSTCWQLLTYHVHESVLVQITDETVFSHKFLLRHMRTCQLPAYGAFHDESQP